MPRGDAHIRTPQWRDEVQAKIAPILCRVNYRLPPGQRIISSVKAAGGGLIHILDFSDAATMKVFIESQRG